jgi:parallel beta-helix repeat protein
MTRAVLVIAGAAVGATVMAGAALAGSGSSGPEPREHVRVVLPGQSIQATVDKAQPGDTILLRPGRYRQSVTITTSGITLRGSEGTVLLPPDPAPPAACQDNEQKLSGICVIGQKDALTENVRITGITLTGWPGDGVFGLSTGGLTIDHDAALRNGDYGFARFASTGSSITGNVSRDNGDAGVYVGDSPNALTIVRDNALSGNRYGIFIRHSHGVEARGNTVTGNCQGIFVLDDGQPGGVGDVLITRNTVAENNKLCAPTGGAHPAPPLRGGGILLLGAQFATVAFNQVTGNQGGENNSGGILVASATPLTHGQAERAVAIFGNTVTGNAPGDVIWDHNGTDIEIP